MYKHVAFFFFSGIFPQLWSVGYISPVFKAGDAGDPNNYRGITVCSCLGKFFTLIINERLTKYLDKNNIIYNNQIGFRKGYRTSDHIFVQKCLDRLNCYFKKWKMKINIKKTKIIVFNRSGKIFKGQKFKIGKQPIEITDSYV